MPESIPQLNDIRVRRVAAAAALAQEQLAQAQIIVSTANPAFPRDSQMIGAVVQAIATNYLALVTKAST